MPLGEHVVNDYRYLSLSLKAHPLSFLRAPLDGTPHLDHAALRATAATGAASPSPPGPHPPTAGHGQRVIFMTLEGRDRHCQHHTSGRRRTRRSADLLRARLVGVTGKCRARAASITSSPTSRGSDRMLAALAVGGDEHRPLARADESGATPASTRGQDPPRRVQLMRHPRNGPLAPTSPRLRAAHEVMPKGRNFH